MKKLIALFLLLFSYPALAQVNYTTYAAGGPTPCLGCGAVLSSGTVESINFNWGGGQVLDSGRSDGVVVKFTGYITIPGSGSQNITFYNVSDDGFILKISGATIINNWREQGPSYYNSAGGATLVGGQTYAFEVWYYENGGGAVAMLYWDQSGSIQRVGGSQYTIVQPNPKTFGDGGQSLPSANVSLSQSSKINQTNSITQNSVYINATGSNNSVYIQQVSRQNQIRGVNGAQALTINGYGNSITINQGTTTTPTGKNLAEVSVTGDNNVITLTQQHGSKYAEIVTNGIGNQISAQQKDANGKSLFINALGNANNINATQEGLGNHFLQIDAPFGGVSATVSQMGSSAKQFQLILNNPGIGVTVSQNNLTAADSAKMEITCTTGPCNGYSYTKN